MSRRSFFVLLVLLALPLRATQFTVPADGSWVRTGIHVTRGTRLQVAATGIAGVGPAGSFGPAGSSQPVAPSPGRLFPSDGPAYSLVLRLTSSATNADDEVRQDFTVAQLNGWCSPNDGYLWLIVNDDDRSDNGGAFTVDIETSPCDAPAPVLGGTLVRVWQAGAPVPGAEVFVDGRSVRTTDANGEALLPPLRQGAQIVARTRVAESPTDRANHSAGSTRNWKFRAYLTSAVVQDDGSIATHTVTDPAAVQELQVLPTNSLIGLHLTAGTEWDAAPFELRGIGDRVRAASQWLYNATDGHFFIEQVEILDNATQWDDVDYRLFANQSLRAWVGRAGSFFGGCCGNDFMHMNRFNNPYVYAHEFAHYGMNVLDEYSDGDGTVSCSSVVRAETGAFSVNGPQGSCMMWNRAQKFCSAHPSNPHVGGTRQGGLDCWTTFTRFYADTGTFPRWSFRTPATRTQIPGMLPPILTAWETRVEARNVRDGELCSPFRVVPRNRATGAPDPTIEVFLRLNESGRTLLMGQAPVDNPMTPVNETSEIGVTISGAGPGDRIIAGDAVLLVPSCAIDVSASLTSVPQFAGLVPPPLAQWTAAGAKMETRFLEAGPKAAAVSVQPDGKGTASVALRFREDVSAPTLTFLEVGKSKPVQVALQLDESGVWRGSFPDSSETLLGDLFYEAKRSAGGTATGVERISITPIAADRTSEVRSADGQLSMSFGKGSMATDRVAIARAAIDGDNIAAGPYSVTAASGLAGPATLRFQLPDALGDTVDAFDPMSFRIVRHDGGGAWTELQTVPIVDVGVITARVGALGTFALTARPRGSKNAPKVASLSAALDANPSKASGACPVTITFEGAITSDRAGEISYTFERSDGATGPVEKLQFDEPGTRKVSTSWQLGGAALPQYSGWQAIRILTPAPLRSNEAAFSVSCQ